MNSKKILACALATTTMLTSSIVSFANEQPDTLHLKEIEALSIDLNSQEMNKARVLSYNEMKKILTEDGYTEEEAIKLLGPEFENTNEMKTHNQLNNISPRGFMEFKATPVKSKTKNHTVDLYAYCEYSSAGTYGAIQTVKHVRVDAGSRAFEGEVYYNLETPLRIYFSISGKLYSSAGKVNFTGGVEVELEEGTTAKFEISRERGDFVDTVSDSTYYRRN